MYGLFWYLEGCFGGWGGDIFEEGGWMWAEIMIIRHYGLFLNIILLIFCRCCCGWMVVFVEFVWHVFFDEGIAGIVTVQRWYLFQDLFYANFYFYYPDTLSINSKIA
jgi:hypothetical protein